MYLHRNRENVSEKSERLSEKSFHNHTDSDNLSNHRKSTCKKSQGQHYCSQISVRHLILYAEKRKDGANTTCLWPPKRNCNRYNDALLNTNAHMMGKQWLLLAMRSNRIIFVYTPSRQHTVNFNSSNKRKLFHNKKSKKQTISWRSFDRRRLCRWSSASHKYTSPSRIASA